MTEKTQCPLCFGQKRVLTPAVTPKNVNSIYGSPGAYYDGSTVSKQCAWEDNIKCPLCHKAGEVSTELAVAFILRYPYYNRKLNFPYAAKPTNFWPTKEGVLELLAFFGLEECK